MFEHFKTVDEFDQYLKTIKRPTWLKRIVVHHTYTPTVADWKGLRSMQAIYRYYRLLGWNAYPHIFVAQDGIWVMNPLNRIGIHANAANIDSYGFEIVGRYDTIQWQEPIKSFAIGAIARTTKWANIPLFNIVPHRQFNKTKSCPGNAITMSWVRRLVQLENAQRYKVIVDVANVREDSSTNDHIKFKLQKGDVIISSAFKVDKNEHKNALGEVYKWIYITALVHENNTIKDESGYIREDLVSRFN
jgi:N-acetylmuramoyl-L-alanine amidase CwlA